MILFTGLTGTSGSALVDVLSQNQYKEHFRVLVRKTTNLEQLNNSGLDFEVVYGNYKDVESLTDAMSGCDAVFHIAAKSYIREIAEAAARSKTVKRCVLVSSTSIYSQYRATEYLTEYEATAKKTLEDNGIVWTIIRPTMIFGTLRDNNISVFMGMLDKYKIFPVVKGGKPLLQPVHRYDLAQGYYLILQHIEECENDEFVISGKEPEQLIDILKKIGKSIGRRNRFINLPFGLANACVNAVYYCAFKKRKFDYREKLFRLTEDRAFSHEKITQRFGYEPESFENRLQDLAKAYLEKKGK